MCVCVCYSTRHLRISDSHQDEAVFLYLCATYNLEKSMTIFTSSIYVLNSRTDKVFSYCRATNVRDGQFCIQTSNYALNKQSTLLIVASSLWRRSFVSTYMCLNVYVCICASFWQYAKIDSHVLVEVDSALIYITY